MSRLKAWWLGFRECRSQFGRTWQYNQDLNVAYDHGRYFGWWLFRIKGT